MNIRFHRASHGHLTRPGIGALRILVTAALQAARDWQRARRCARETATLRRLDAASLRDMGIHPSEIASLWAESDGEAEISRRHTNRPRARREAP